MGTLDRLVNQSLDQRASLPCSPASARCSRSSWRRRVMARHPRCGRAQRIGHAGAAAGEEIDLEPDCRAFVLPVAPTVS